MQKDEVIRRLKDGNQRFVENKLENNNQTSAHRETLLKGQSPFAVVLSCADSRVVPELIFDAGLGEIFTIRVAGNVANTDSIASIEYAVSELGVSVIVVLGHQSCGAVSAAIKGGKAGPNLDHLLAQITPAVNETSSGATEDVIRNNTKMAVEKMCSESEIISNAVEKSDLKIIPAYYSLESGKVDL